MRRGRQFIVGMDIATSCGCADGIAGGSPRAWTWRLTAVKGRPERLARLRDYCDRYFAENPIDALFYEAPLPLGALFAQVAKHGVQAAFRMGATDETLGFLRGAIGVVEACAAKAGIPRIEAVDVQVARKHLLGSGRIPKGEGKALVQERCQVLGWRPTNDDESDAMAIWSLGCGLTSPAMAAYTTPLFSRL